MRSLDISDSSDFVLSYQIKKNVSGQFFFEIFQNWIFIHNHIFVFDLSKIPKKYSKQVVCWSTKAKSKLYSGIIIDASNNY